MGGPPGSRTSSITDRSSSPWPPASASPYIRRARSSSGVFALRRPANAPTSSSPSCRVATGPGAGWCGPRIIREPLADRAADPAIVPDSTSRRRSRSRPARRARARASAAARVLTESRSCATNLVWDPAPNGPRWWTRPARQSRTGRTTANAASSPLAKIEAVRAVTIAGIPLIGASSTVVPRTASASRQRSLVSSGIVPISTTTRPGWAPSTRPSAPRATLSNASGPGSRTRTTSQAEASSAGDAVLPAPRASNSAGIADRR